MTEVDCSVSKDVNPVTPDNALDTALPTPVTEVIAVLTEMEGIETLVGIVEPVTDDPVRVPGRSEREVEYGGTVPGVLVS